jgi:hypothetical protein
MHKQPALLLCAHLHPCPCQLQRGHQATNMLEHLSSNTYASDGTVLGNDMIWVLP